MIKVLIKSTLEELGVDYQYITRNKKYRNEVYDEYYRCQLSSKGLHFLIRLDDITRSIDFQVNDGVRTLFQSLSYEMFKESPAESIKSLLDGMTEWSQYKLDNN